MDDREMLESAANACGFQWRWFGNKLCTVRDFKVMRHEHWDPLGDDGDALRLAMHLELGVVCKREGDTYEKNTSVVTNPYCVNQIRITQPHKGYPESATRRAIVRAAAEIGKLA